MKNQNGITMISLVIYILAFVIIIGIVGNITVFFNNNVKDINMAAGISSEYNKFNLYMLDQTKNGYKISKCSSDSEEKAYVTFSDGTTSNTFVLLGELLYFNNIKICDNIQEFKVSRATASNGKEVLKTYLNIKGTVYTTDYVIE